MHEMYLEIEGLTVKTRIGVHAWEQHIDQTLRLDITCPLPPEVSDLSETVDYAALCDLVTTHLRQGTFALVETVAAHIATLILEQFPVPSVTVTVSKPLAVHQASNVKIKVIRFRKL